jgi:CO/xanthine dehydrogenase FAD-binding subunit
MTGRPGPGRSPAGALPDWRCALAVSQSVDEPEPFRLLRPTRLDELSDLLRDHPGAAILGGGTELILDLRRRLRAPSVVISLTGIDALTRVDGIGGEVRIGAAATLADIAADPLVARRAPAVAQAAAAVGVPQVRAQATIGGNLGQHVRCLYLWRGVPCRRNGGSGCPARQAGIGADFAALGPQRACPATLGSDLAAALVASGAAAELLDPAGLRRVEATALWSGGGPDAVVCRILVPAAAPTWGAYRKVSPANGGAFDTVGAALAGRPASNSRLAGARLAVAGIASWPWRWRAVEEVLRTSGARAALRRLDALIIAEEWRDRVKRALVADAVNEVLDEFCQRSSP